MASIANLTDLDGANTPFNYKSVRLGRTARGLSQEELSSMTDIPQGRLSKIENGNAPLSERDVALLAETLDFPPSFFKHDVVESGSVSDVFHRKKVASGAKTVSRLHTWLSLQSHRIGLLLDAVNVNPKRKMMSIDPIDFDDDIEAIAKEVRRAWAIPAGPIDDLTRVVEMAGIMVFRVDLSSPHVSGVSQWVEGSMPIVFINSSCPADRYRHTLAHELGHLFMHAGNFRAQVDIESEADRFAAEFLMPHGDIVTDLGGNLTLDRVASMKPYWRVSMQSLIRRARDTNAISDNQYRWLMIQMSKNRWRSSEPVTIDQEKPRLASRVLDAFLGTGLSREEVCDLLAVSPHDLRVWFQGDGLQAVK